jgi:hypothetical protein
MRAHTHTHTHTQRHLISLLSFLELSTVMKYLTEPWNWTNSLARPKHRKIGTILGTWNVRSLCRSGLLKTVSSELGKYKLDLVGMQEVRRVVLSGQRIIHRE